MEKEEVKSRVLSVRIRTTILTITMIVCIVFYCLMQWVFTGKIDLITLCIVGALQILTHYAYFDEGSVFGEKDKIFCANKLAYNLKATKINENHQFGDLREYCKYEFEERKQRYLLAEFAKIGISQEEFNELKQKSQQEIKKLKSHEWDGKIIYFTKSRKKMLYNLIFNPLPVKENEPEFIMSAINMNLTDKIKDGSVSYATVQHIRKILKATILAVFFSYVGFTFKNFSYTNLIEMIFYLGAVFTTAIISYSYGERCTKVYKNILYIKLGNFIDEFNEWEQKKLTNQNQ